MFRVPPCYCTSQFPRSFTSRASPRNRHDATTVAIPSGFRRAVEPDAITPQLLGAAAGPVARLGRSSTCPCSSPRSCFVPHALGLSLGNQVCMYKAMPGRCSAHDQNQTDTETAARVTPPPPPTHGSLSGFVQDKHSAAAGQSRAERRTGWPLRGRRDGHRG
jgi:hypothetical protein